MVNLKKVTPNFWFRYVLCVFALLFCVMTTYAAEAPAARAGEDAPQAAQQQTQQQTGITSVSAETMLKNIAKQLPFLMRMVTAIAYVLGLVFIIKGVMKLKEFGESRTMMSAEHGLKGPLVYLIVGALLLYLPSAVQVGLSTFWSEPNPYGYLQEQDQWAEFINIVYVVVQFIGVIAFIRGLVILSHLGAQGGQPGTLGKGLTHIIGGIFCINIYQFVQVILNTLGIQP